MLKKPIALGLVLAALTGCSGAVKPELPRNLNDRNSLRVVVRVDGESPAQVALHAGYTAKAEECRYTPRAFGIFAQTNPVPSTAYEKVPVTHEGSAKFAARVPLPASDKCLWAINRIEPSISIAGVHAVFLPSMSVTGRNYLPEGDLTYHCGRSERRDRQGMHHFFVCRLERKGTETTTIHVSVKK